MTKYTIGLLFTFAFLLDATTNGTPISEKVIVFCFLFPICFALCMWADWLEKLMKK